MSRPIILGTAGHIDHGKTSLVKVLTGIDTDRLKEEKERGITIELGFAHLALPDGRMVGIIDVPGHEKFVKHMVAGVTGIDLVALVIAADEGVMPQTREHLDICELLGVRYGLIVLTKVDMVDQDWADLVEEDIREFVSGTFLANAPMVHFSAVDGRGAGQVVAEISNIISRIEERQRGGLFRMPLDRVFTMKGFGTVVTGTALSGSLAVGDTVRLYPGPATAKVRGLQVHNQSVQEVAAGLRTAINLQGLDRDTVDRGQVLAHPDTLAPSRRIDVAVTYLAGNAKPLKNRTRIRFHAGTAELLGILLLLDADELKPGQKGIAQVQLEKEAVTLGRDRFVLRSYSPVRTIGGGMVLHPDAPRHKRFQEATLTDLAVLGGDDPVAAVKTLIQDAGFRGLSVQGLAALIDLPLGLIKSSLDKLLSQREAIAFDKDQGRIISRAAFENLTGQTLSVLEEYHRQYPLRPGINKEELKTRVPALADQKLHGFIISHLEKTRAAGITGDAVHLAGHKLSLAEDQRKIEAGLIRAYEKSGLTPPNYKDMAQELPGTPDEHKEVLEMLMKKGILVRIKADLYYHRQALDQARSLILAHFQSHKELTTPEFKELTNISRKYLIPLLEYFDAQGLTMRLGDARVLRTEKK